MAFFRPDLKRKNDGCAAYLLGVEGISNFLAAVPCPDGTRMSWVAAVEVMVQTKFDTLNHLLSDRDCAIKDHQFRARFAQKHKIKWTFLTNRSKCRKRMMPLPC
jgi:hypothetical protein